MDISEQLSHAIHIAKEAHAKQKDTVGSHTLGTVLG